MGGIAAVNDTRSFSITTSNPTLGGSAWSILLMLEKGGGGACILNIEYNLKWHRGKASSKVACFPLVEKKTTTKSSCGNVLIGCRTRCMDDYVGGKKMAGTIINYYDDDDDGIFPS